MKITFWGKNLEVIFGSQHEEVYLANTTSQGKKIKKMSSLSLFVVQRTSKAEWVTAANLPYKKPRFEKSLPEAGEFQPKADDFQPEAGEIQPEPAEAVPHII